MSLIGLLVVLLVACVVIWCARMLIAAFGLPAPIGTVIYVIVVIVVLLYVIRSFGLSLHV